MNLSWIKCESGDWCGLNRVNLSNDHFDSMEGVYIIWCGKDGTCVKVGQGKVRDRFEHHKNDPAIQHYANNNLLTTWARVEKISRDGVERYLADRFKPVVADRFPNAQPIPVNSPFE